MTGPAPPADVAALLARADRALGSGAVAAAAADYEAALARRPDHPEAWFNLGWARRALRQFAPALEAYGEAIARGIAQPEAAHLNRAAILSDHLWQPDAAEAALRAALAANPAFVPAWLSLGMLHEDRGALDAARAAYAAVLRLRPGDGRAHARLATVETLAGEARAAVARLRPAIAAAPTPEDRAEMLFALAAALDAIGDYGDAWQAIEAANWIARALSPARYDARAVEAQVDRQIAAFRAPPAPLDADDGPPPIFICGMFRSGSTLAEQLLARHPRIAAGGELDWIPARAQALPGYPESVAAMSDADRRRLRADYRASLPAGGRVIDKRCDNVFHLGLITALFPEAVIVHTRRQPLDNLLSIYFLHFGDGVTYGHDLGEAAHYFIQYRRLLDHLRPLLGAPLVDLDYDGLVRAPQAALTPVLDALDLPWDAACLAVPEPGEAVRTASALHVRQPLHARSSGRWRHYVAALAPVRARLAAAGIDA